MLSQFLLLNPKLKLLLKTFYDFAMAGTAYVLAFLLRFNFNIPEIYVDSLFKSLPVVLLLQFGTFIVFGQYRRVWRYASLHDLINLFKAVLIAAALSVVVMFMVRLPVQVPRSIFIIDALLLLFLLGWGRFMYRALQEGVLHTEKTGTKTVIVGAGEAGSELIRTLRSNKNLKLNILGFIDDNSQKSDTSIYGAKVIGNVDELQKIVEQLKIEQVLIAIPSATGKQIQRILSNCEQTDAVVKTIPTIDQLFSGKASIEELRSLRIEDLLHREPVALDSPAIANMIEGKKVMVTGAGGSIGSELCRQIITFNPERLILIDNSEFLLYQSDIELKDKYNELSFTSYVANVCDENSMSKILSFELPEIILHAAAYKHVPLMEAHPREAVLNNVGGTLVVAGLADKFKVSKFVLISTDKAVNPVNVMGATKRTAEMICQAFQERSSSTNYITVRFGNVLASHGSVVPRFMEQINSGGPVTITHPDIKRYFMSVSEASLLVLMAAALGDGGEIYVLDMGDQIKIEDLARAMIKLSGKIPDRDVEIVFTGLRPGEKLYEELFGNKETMIPTPHKKIFSAKTVTVAEDLLIKLAESLPEISRFTLSNVKGFLGAVVPEYKPAKIKQINNSTVEKKHA